MICFYKKTFLKDLAKSPLDYRKKVERIVFEDIPKSIEEEMPLERPVPLDLLHEFLSEGEEPAKVEKIPKLKVLAYG